MPSRRLPLPPPRPLPRRPRPPRRRSEEIGEGLIGGTTSTGRTAVLVGYGVKQTEAKRRPRTGATPACRRRPTVTRSRTAGAVPPTGRSADRPVDRRRSQAAPSRAVRALAKPPVRKLAKDLGVDLASVTPTGEGGIVTRADVEAAAAGGAGAVAGCRRRRAGRAHRRSLDARRRARGARPDQGRAQDDRAGDGRLGVHRAARHRVGHRRRHAPRWTSSSASRRTGSSATSR